MPIPYDPFQEQDYDDYRDQQTHLAGETLESLLGEEGCLFPTECCMPGPHYTSECHTPEMLIAQEREHQVYVDPLMPCIPKKSWPWPLSCHLCAYNLATLHAFAAQLGLKRAWFQHQPGRLPHYDLTPNKRAQAVRLGAIEIQLSQLRELIHHWRQHTSR